MGDRALQRLGTALALLGAWSPREGLEGVRLDSFGKLALVHGGRWLPAIAPLFMGRGRMFEPTEALVDAVYGGGGGGGGTGGGVEGGGDAWPRAAHDWRAARRRCAAVGAATIDRFPPPEALGVLADGFRSSAFFQKQFNDGGLTTFSYDLALPPANLVEQLIAHYVSLLPEEEASRMVLGVVGALPGIAPLQFEGHPYHWDHDEELRMQKGEGATRGTRPCFVEGDAGGGPTVVTDGRIRPDRRARAGKSIHAHMTSSDGRAWAVWPASNRALVFDGRCSMGCCRPPRRRRRWATAPR